MGVPMFLVGHVTKSGEIAGGRGWGGLKASARLGAVQPGAPYVLSRQQPSHHPFLEGPRVLEHIVDVVLYMEGGRQSPVRLVGPWRTDGGVGGGVSGRTLALTTPPCVGWTCRPEVRV